MISGATNKSEDLKNDVEERIEYGKSRLWTGVSFIDEGTFGIARDDLLLIGAYSGSGKTELATTIALNNVAQGKKVFFYALEAADKEIEHRVLYRLMCENFFKDQQRPRVDLSYAAWVYGDLPEVAVYDIQAQETFRNKYKNLFTFYKTQSFTVSEFVKEFSGAAADGADLVIIDHAHYFDWGDRNENDGLKEVITQARDMNLLNQVPIILISHLRKSDRKNETFAPTQEDFHGSSELYKRSTKAILLGPGDYDKESRCVGTYVNIAKARVSGESTRVTGRMRFNFERNTYEKEYDVGRPNQKRDREFETLIANDIPRWCKSARGSYNNKNAHRPSPTVSTGQRGREFAESLPYKD